MTTKQVTYWVPLQSSPDAVEVAKRAARDEGFTVVTVAKVKWAPRPPDFVPAWDVSLALKVKEGVEPLDLDGLPFCPTGSAQRYHNIGECFCERVARP